WIDKLHSAEDWPEWVKILNAPVGPDHVVSYDVHALGPPGGVVTKLHRIINGYLVDPTTTNSPVGAHFRLLESGAHCGYDHGSSVWIEYIAPEPRYTAEVWNPSLSYALDDVTYSAQTGECYRSKVNSNMGHDPSVATVPAPVLDLINIPIPTEVTQK